MRLERFHITGRIWMALLTILSGFSSGVLAQEQTTKLNSYLELSASEIRAKTVEVINGSMNFTEEEAKVFWPVYKRYEAECGTITDRSVALIKDYQANYKALSDNKAKELAGKLFEIDEQKVSLNRKFYNEFCRVLPPARMLYFFQIARRIDTLLNLRVATILPMIGEDW